MCYYLTKTLINFRIAAIEKVNRFNMISNILVKHIWNHPKIYKRWLEAIDNIQNGAENLL